MAEDLRIVRASIFMATYNKGDVLPNVLYSISRQKTSFPFEVCLVDDCSQDYPVEHLEKFLGSIMWKYLPLNRNVGCAQSQSKCLMIMDPRTDVIVLQSSDVLYAGDDVLEKLVTGVEPGVFTMAEVRNVDVQKDLWKSWKNLDRYLMEERLHETLDAINQDPRQPQRGKYSLCHTIFSGPRQPDPDRRLYFFLGAISRGDLLKTCFEETCFDVALSKSLLSLGMKVKYVDAVGIHQKHPI